MLQIGFLISPALKSMINPAGKMPKQHKLKQVVRKATNFARSRPRGNKTTGGQGAADIGEHLDLVAGLTDPFCSSARGARIPDQGAARTVTEYVSTMYPITTNAQGNAAVSFQSNARFPILPYSSWNVAEQRFYFAADFIELDNNSAHAVRARIVTMGIRVLCLQSATAASGQIILAKASEITPGSTLTVSPSKFAEFEPFPIEHGGEWCSVAHPRGTEYQDWVSYDLSSSTTALGVDAFDNLVVFIMGSAVNATVATVELVMNVEFVVSDNSSMSQFARDQPVFNPQLQVAANHVQSAHSGIVKGAKAKITKELKSHATKAVRKHLLPFLEKKALQVLL